MNDPQARLTEVKDKPYAAGFVALVGRPNAGKSTLTNALVGEKVAITSSKPQTTRHAIRGIITLPNAQIVLVDTPGIHRPRTLLGQRLNDLVQETLADVDVICFCLPADQKVGPGDRHIAQTLADLQKMRRAPKVIAVVTKTDLVKKSDLADHLISVDQLLDFDAIIPLSAVTGQQVDTLLNVIPDFLPESPQLYPDDALTDETDTKRIAELIREAALEGVRDELPHSLAVVVEEMIEDEDDDADPPRLTIHANIFVERTSQKGIIIGKGGSRLKEVGTQSRQGIQKLLGRRVYLDLHVKVAKDWQRDPKQLRKLGF